MVNTFFLNFFLYIGQNSSKLDGVGPIDTRPSTNKLHHCQKRRKKKYMWHGSCLGGWTFSQNFSSIALTVCDLWYYEDLEEKDDWLNQLMNDEAVNRTAAATPGLLRNLDRNTDILISNLLLEYVWLREVAKLKIHKFTYLHILPRQKVHFDQVRWPTQKHRKSCE